MKEQEAREPIKHLQTLKNEFETMKSNARSKEIQ